MKRKIVHITLDNGDEAANGSKTLCFQEISMFAYDIPKTVIWLGEERGIFKGIKNIAITAVDGKKLLSGRVNWKQSPLNIQSGVSFEVL